MGWQLSGVDEIDGRSYCAGSWIVFCFDENRVENAVDCQFAFAVFGKSAGLTGQTVSILYDWFLSNDVHKTKSHMNDTRKFMWNLITVKSNSDPPSMGCWFAIPPQRCPLPISSILANYATSAVNSLWLFSFFSRIDNCWSTIVGQTIELLSPVCNRNSIQINKRYIFS